MKAGREMPKKIFLVGFSGSGKSTVGPMLAKRLRYGFVDTDGMIARKAGKSIVMIFAEDGEKAFRAVETEVIREIADMDGVPMVVALGGGAFVRTENRELIESAGVAVYLECSVREIERRMRYLTDRPLLAVRLKRGESINQAGKRRIRELMEKRRHYYGMADITVSTTKRTPREAAREVVRRLEGRYGAR